MTQREREIAKLSRSQFSHKTDLPRKQIRDRLIKFEFFADVTNAQRDLKEIPVEPKGIFLTSIPSRHGLFLRKEEHTYVKARTHTIG